LQIEQWLGDRHKEVAMYAPLKLALVVVEALMAAVLLGIGWIIQQHISTTQVYILGAGVVVVAYGAMVVWAQSNEAEVEDERGELRLVSRDGDVSIYRWIVTGQEAASDR
jgi:hypothetical protein